MSTKQQQQKTVAVAGRVPIPRGVTDPFYRYWMPDMFVTNQRGNTVIKNLAEVSQALSRPAELLLKHFGWELGVPVIAPSTANNKQHMIKGIHDYETLWKVLDVFIEKYCLCHKCRHPGVMISTSSSATPVIQFSCSGCGAVSSTVANSKTDLHIHKNPPPVSPVVLKMLQETQNRYHESSDTTHLNNSQQRVIKRDTKEEDDDDWSCDVSPEAVAARRLTAVSRLESNNQAIQLQINKLIAKAIDEAHSRKSSVAVVSLLERLQQEPVDVSGSASHPLQHLILDNLNKLVDETANQKVVVPTALKVLYDVDVLEEDNVLSWVASHPQTSALTIASAPFINWLQTADEQE